MTLRPLQRAWNAMKPLSWRSIISNDVSRTRLTHHYRGGWYEMHEMSVEKWWNEIYGRRKRENIVFLPVIQWQIEFYMKFISILDIYYFINMLMSVAVAWSIEPLPPNLAARVWFPEESGILISILGQCVSSVFCPVFSLAACLTFRSTGIQEGPHFYICLGFWSLVCVPLQASDSRIFEFMSPGEQVLHWGRVNTRQTNKNK